MTKLLSVNSENRRKSTIIRHNLVHEVYDSIIKELGPLANVVSRGFIYKQIHERTGLNTKSIAYIINHTQKTINSI